MLAVPKSQTRLILLSPTQYPELYLPFCRKYIIPRELYTGSTKGLEGLKVGI